MSDRTINLLGKDECWGDASKTEHRDKNPWMSLYSLVDKNLKTQGSIGA
jgi:hypothetical protein